MQLLQHDLIKVLELPESLFSSPENLSLFWQQSSLISLTSLLLRPCTGYSLRSLTVNLLQLKTQILAFHKPCLAKSKIAFSGFLLYNPLHECHQHCYLRERTGGTGRVGKESQL